MNTLAHGTVKLASHVYFNNAGDLVKAIEELVDMTPEKDASIVDIQIAPAVDYQGGTSEKEGTIHLFEETLSDGSKVYSIEIY